MDAWTPDLDAASHKHTRGPLEYFTAALRDILVADARPTLMFLVGAALFVVLIACANVANLLLTRGSQRRTEIATRVAMGASPGRIIRQLLTVSGLLAAVGGLNGLALGYVGVRWRFHQLLVVAWSARDLPLLSAMRHSGASHRRPWDGSDAPE